MISLLGSFRQEASFASQVSFHVSFFLHWQQPFKAPLSISTFLETLRNSNMARWKVQHLVWSVWCCSIKITTIWCLTSLHPQESCMDLASLTPHGDRLGVCGCFYRKADHRTGWWFGCHLLMFPIYWEFHHPSWLSYFSEGWPNHQPAIIFKVLFNLTNPLSNCIVWIRSIQGRLCMCGSVGWAGVLSHATLSTLLLAACQGSREI